MIHFPPNETERFLCSATLYFTSNGTSSWQEMYDTMVNIVTGNWTVEVSGEEICIDTFALPW